LNLSKPASSFLGFPVTSAGSVLEPFYPLSEATWQSW
jgi:hypothetical protein